MNSEDTSGERLSGQEMLDRLARLDPESAARVDAIREARGPLGAQLHTARLKARLDVWELAEQAGIDREIVVGIEHGTHTPTWRDLVALGVALDIDFTIGKSSAA